MMRRLFNVLLLLVLVQADEDVHTDSKESEADREAKFFRFKTGGGRRHASVPDQIEFSIPLLDRLGLPQPIHQVIVVPLDLSVFDLVSELSSVIVWPLPCSEEAAASWPPPSWPGRPGHPRKRPRRRQRQRRRRQQQQQQQEELRLLRQHLSLLEFGADVGLRVKTVPEESAESDSESEESAEAKQQPGRIATGAPRCTTPQGGSGRCRDIGACPLLLADLDRLRKSICFKRLFVPGVCCPDNGVQLVAVDDQLNVVNAVEEIEEHNKEPNVNHTLPFGLDNNEDKKKIPQSGPHNHLEHALNVFDATVPFTSTECGSSKIAQARIVGGNATLEGEYPWMVAIFLHGGGRREFWCGGALVGPTQVITAAHCTRDTNKRPFRASQFTVRVGEWDLSDADEYSEEFRVVAFHAHPEFRPNGFYNDLAIFHLDQPVTFTQHIQPLCLPTGRHRHRSFVGSLPVALGWGTTRYGGNEVSRLRGVALPVWTNNACDAAYFQPITEIFLCAGYADGGRDACQGDSGGPLMLYDEETQTWMLIGVVSFGNRCAQKGYPGVFTRITHFLPFILERF